MRILCVPFSYNHFLVDIWDYDKKAIRKDRVSPLDNQAPSQGNQVHPQDQDVIIPPSMRDGEIRSAFMTFTQDMTTQSQEVGTQAQNKIAQANREVGPRVQPIASTMGYRFRNFARMNPLLFYGSKVNKDP